MTRPFFIMKKSELISFGVRILAGVGILVVLTKFVPYRELMPLLAKADLRLIVASWALFALLFVGGAFRWLIALRATDVRASAGDAIFLTYSGLFLNLFCPSFIAQDAYRTALIAQKTKATVTEVLSTIVMDRVSGFVGLFSLASVAVAFSPLARADRIAFTAIGVLGCALFVLLSLMISRRVAVLCAALCAPLPKAARFLEGLFAKLRICRARPSAFVAMAAISVALHFGVVVVFWHTALALGVHQPFSYFCAIVPLLIVLSALPITIGGLGTREAGSVYFFAMAGVPAAAGMGISLFSFVYLLVCGLIGGVMYVACAHRWVQSDAQTVRSE